MKSKEILHALVILLRYVGGALLAIALVRLLIVPVWYVEDGSAYTCSYDQGWGGILTSGNSDRCEGAAAIRMFSCAMWGGLGIGLLLAGVLIRDEVVGQD